MNVSWLERRLGSHIAVALQSAKYKSLKCDEVSF